MSVLFLADNLIIWLGSSFPSQGLTFFGLQLFWVQYCFGPNILKEQKSFWTPNLLDQTIFWLNLFIGPKTFLNPNVLTLLDPKFVSSTFFYPKFFWTKFFLGPICLGTKYFLEPTCLRTKKIFGHKIMMGTVTVTTTVHPIRFPMATDSNNAVHANRKSLN